MAWTRIWADVEYAKSKDLITHYGASFLTLNAYRISMKIID